MKLLKPHWVHHDDKPIFSVDVHISCLKFATGGQGNDSGRIVIWNLVPVLYEKAEKDETIPKLLCQMDSHLACVNVVRWSTNGEMLASGSDDKLIMVWKMCKGSGGSGVFGSGGMQQYPESWKCVSTLRGHAGDVLDLAWSPQDRWLASCSVDNTVIVWDVQTMPITLVRVLKGHTGLVKGVSWDPVGKFLGSQSDDRSVKIWKTSDWSCNNTLTTPFEGCGGTTHVLRLSWSPDGQYLVSAHAMNGGGPTAQIIEREGWKCDKDFVGHRKAVTCVRFHNSILSRHVPKANIIQQYCCLAIGSRDRSLSVWITALQRPLVVVHDLFKDSILDLSWGAEKRILIACSGDGSIACLQFSERELGYKVSEEEKNILYQRIYGKSATVEAGASARDHLIENAEFLRSVNQKPKPPTIPGQQPNNNYRLDPKVQNDNGNIKVQTKIEAKPVITKQIETRTADGKRRITPVFIPLSLTQDTVNGNSECQPSTSGMDTNQNELELHLPDEACALPTVPVLPTLTVSEQIRLDNRLTKTTVPTTSAGILKATPVQYQAIPNTSNGPTLNLQQTATKNGQIEVIKAHEDFRIHLQNSNTKTPYGPLCRIQCYKISLNEKLWEIFIGSAVVNFCLCNKYVLLCSLDGTLRFLDICNGISVLPILSLSTAAIQCTFCPLGKLAGIISECGHLRIWNIELKSVVISSTCADIFSKSGQVMQFNITANGIPFILFSNGSAYSYSNSMDCWMVLNSKDPIIRQGLQTIPTDFQQDIQKYPLMTIQTANRGGASSSMDGNADWQIAAKLSFIENQIKLSETINSPDELKYWYSMLAYHLSINGTEKRIRLVLDNLLIPVQNLNLQITENGQTLNINKAVLLNTVLEVLRSNPRWQRIYMEYTEQLSFFGNY